CSSLWRSASSRAALTSAYWGGARVLGLIGAVPTWARGRGVGVLHDLADPAAVLSQITKHTAIVDDPGSAADTVQTALDELVSGRPRPVTLEFPVDVWPAEASGRLRPPRPSTPTVDPEDVGRAAAILADAERPLIVVGSGAYEASDLVVALAERIGAPVFERRMGHGVVPTAHPLSVPYGLGHELWAEADLAIGIGTRMELPLTRWGVDDRLTIVRIDIDRDELDRHRLGTTGLLGDAADVVAALLAALGDEPDREHGDLLADLDRRRARWAERLALIEPQGSYLRAIREVMPDDGVIVEDVTQIGFAAHLLYDHRRPRCYLSSGAAGTLGAAVAVGIGAQDAAADRPVLTISGDGGFLFGATELATAVQHDIATTVVVFNDSAYGNVWRMQKAKFGPDRTIASELQNPDLVAFARSFGVGAERVDSPEGLRPALDKALTHPGPALVEVTVGEMPDPWEFLMFSRVRGSR
ncbi:MAG: thiamine pyrophosphate-dependent enzyme, partial [Acidimicrobiales bacterium]